MGPIQRRRALTAMDGAITLVVVLLLVQMWVLTAALDALLAGHADGVLPATVVSGVLFAAALGLYRFIRGIDRSG